MFQNIHRERSVPKSLLNKVSGLQSAALSKKETQKEKTFSCEIIMNMLFYQAPLEDCFWKNLRFFKKRFQ